MRSLRDRLNAISQKPPEPRREPPPRREGCFCRESVFPLEKLRGIENVTLEDIRACDPSFTGNRWALEELLFIDTETTGLSGGAGTVAFEIGAGFIRDGRMIIRQFVMRDYGEEPAMLTELAGMFREACAVVSFNGKSFDLPLIESRMTMNRIRLQVTALPHFDLLHAMRRVYKLRLGRTNLATLEEAVLGMPREDDLPGAQVPERYFTYLKTGEFALLEDVLRHNLQDVRSLAELTGYLCGVFRDPERLRHGEDLFGVGKTLLRTGHTEKGRRVLHLVKNGPAAARAHRVLTESYKRSKDWTAAVRLWQEMISRGEGGSTPYIELAKYYEHVLRDNERALKCSLRALQYEMNTGLLRDTQISPGLEKRIERLNRKLSGGMNRA